MYAGDNCLKGYFSLHLSPHVHGAVSLVFPPARPRVQYSYPYSLSAERKLPLDVGGRQRDGRPLQRGGGHDTRAARLLPHERRAGEETTKSFPFSDLWSNCYIFHGSCPPLQVKALREKSSGRFFGPKGDRLGSDEGKCRKLIYFIIQTWRVCFLADHNKYCPGGFVFV